MKKFTLIVAIIAAISIFGSIFSFFVFDFNNVKNKNYNDFIVGYDSRKNKFSDESLNKEENFENKIQNYLNNVVNTSNDYKFEMIENNLGNFKNIDIDILSGFVKIKKSDKDSLIIKSKDKIDNIYEVLDKKDLIEKNTIKINENNINNISVEILAKNPENLGAEIQTDNGFVEINTTLKNAKIKSGNGMIKLYSDKAYPLDIEQDTGLLKMNFKYYDATFKLENENGLIKYFGNTKISSYDEDSTNLVKGNGKNNIKIKNTNGLIDIN